MSGRSESIRRLREHFHNQRNPLRMVSAAMAGGASTAISDRPRQFNSKLSGNVLRADDGPDGGGSLKGLLPRNVASIICRISLSSFSYSSISSPSNSPVSSATHTFRKRSARVAISSLAMARVETGQGGNEEQKADLARWCTIWLKATTATT